MEARVEVVSVGGLSPAQDQLARAKYWGWGRGSVTLRNSSGSEVSWESARKLRRSSSWVCVSSALASAWRATDVWTSSLPRCMNSGIEKNHRAGADSLAGPPVKSSCGLPGSPFSAGDRPVLPYLQVALWARADMRNLCSFPPSMLT